MRIFFWLFSLLVFCLALISADINTNHNCTTGTTGTGPHSIKVGFMYSGEENDGGYNTNTEIDRDSALKALSQEFTIQWEKCQRFAVADPDIAPIVKRWNDTGFHLVIGNSFNFQSQYTILATTYPRLKLAAGVTSYDAVPPSNLKWHFGRTYRDRFLTGMVCANLTKTGRLGFVAPFPFRAGSVSAPSSFLAGARSVNSSIVIYFVSTPAFEDGPAAEFASKILFDLGVDCVGGLDGTTAVQRYFATRNRFAVGWNNPSLVNDNQFTSINLYWAPFYINFIRQTKNGTFDSNPFQLFEYSASILLNFTKVVPKDVRDAVAVQAAAFSNSDTIFCGNVAAYFNEDYGLKLDAQGCLDNYSAVVGSFLPPYSHIPGSYLVAEILSNGTKKCSAEDYPGLPRNPNLLSSWQASIKYDNSEKDGSNFDLLIRNSTGGIATKTTDSPWPNGSLVRWSLSYNNITKLAKLNITKSGTSIIVSNTVSGSIGKIFITIVSEDKGNVTLKEVRVFRSVPDFCGIVYDTVFVSGNLQNRTLEIAGVVRGSFELSGKFRFWQWSKKETLLAPRILIVVEKTS